MTTIGATDDIRQRRTMRSYVSQGRAAVRRTATPIRVPLLAGGIVVTVIASVLPWAKSGVNFPTDLAGNRSPVRTVTLHVVA